MPTDGVNKGRRRFLVATTSVVGAVGVGFAAVPFVQSWNPSAKAQAVGGPVQVFLGKLEPGQLLKVQWRGQTIGVLRRTEDTIGHLQGIDEQLRDPESLESEQPSFAQNEGRALNEEYPGGQYALHTSGLRAPGVAPGRPPAIRGELERWLFLPLPQVEIRHGRPRLQGRSGTNQPENPTLQLH